MQIVQDHIHQHRRRKLPDKVLKRSHIARGSQSRQSRGDLAQQTGVRDGRPNPWRRVVSSCSLADLQQTGIII